MIGILTQKITGLKKLFEDYSVFKRTEYIEGFRYTFDLKFILKLKIILATDRLEHLNREERIIWNDYISWSKAYHHTVPVNNDGIGCSIPDTNGASFVINTSGNKTTIACVAPVEGLDDSLVILSEALDKLMVELLNCTFEELEKDITVLLESVTICDEGE